PPGDGRPGEGGGRAPLRPGAGGAPGGPAGDGDLGRGGAGRQHGDHPGGAGRDGPRPPHHRRGRPGGGPGRVGTGHPYLTAERPDQWAAVDRRTMSRWGTVTLIRWTGRPSARSMASPALTRPISPLG